MSLENCEIVRRARRLATQKRLDASKVFCEGECSNTNQCPLGKEVGSDLSLTSADVEQEGVLRQLEGQATVRRFYGRLEKWEERKGLSSSSRDDVAA